MRITAAFCALATVVLFVSTANAATCPINASGTNFTEIRLFVHNKSAWPARMTDKLTLRYFFTVEPGVTPQMLTLTTNFNQCQAPTGITQFAGNVFAVNLSCVGVPIYPGGQQFWRKEIQFRIASSGAWNPATPWPRSRTCISPTSPPWPPRPPRARGGRAARREGAGAPRCT